MPDRSPDYQLLGALIVAGAIDYPTAQRIEQMYKLRDEDHVVPTSLDAGLGLAIESLVEDDEEVICPECLAEQVGMDTSNLPVPVDDDNGLMFGDAQPPYFFVAAYEMWSRLTQGFDDDRENDCRG